ncbi:MAG: hypothetical protein P0Y49_10555 [Candidatus Pedobacter colombiensis]|uniref:Cytochrome c oxidase polypeptide IV n=1 Tax=Candidatus Pedobacter colombiensis TaxID=3121371 RepID=A0AAJ5WBL4_9SPHI|nr:hypothetical protein [Pedobacter sp.]WEK21577.1 MAG: hypothetical protein P0Y49_10555 [Pedobacter sp.]
MVEENHKDIEIIPAPNWEKAKPEILPEPTYWPFFLAMGLAFMLWGLLTNWVILLAGSLVFIVALIGWINILRNEGK